MDAAIIGNDSDPTLVLSSAVHGVECFFGSAIQLSLLESLIDKNRSAPIRYVLLHGINPFGFANLRRFDEGNVDLNRNFPANSEDLPEAPELYRRLNSLLNPGSPPRRYDAFMLKLIWCILRFGKQRIKSAIAGGQYAFPKGLFFGGTTPSQAICIVQENCDSWIGGGDVVLHIDLHSGLGGRVSSGQALRSSIREQTPCAEHDAGLTSGWRST